MARWSYAALAVGWILSMVYECVQSGDGAGSYFTLGVLGVTACAILFVRDVTRGKQKHVPRMIFFLAAAITAALFFAAVNKAANAGSYVRFMPLYFVLFFYFAGAGAWMWWKEHK